MPPFKPVKTEKFAQEMANQIKQSIFDGTYASGDKLPSEGELAKLFCVSKVTVRQSVRVLESSGLVYTRQGVEGGIFVAEADSLAVSSYLSDMLKLKRVTQSDLTLSRLIFEPDIASLVASVWRGTDLEATEENLRQAQASLKRGDLGNTRLLNLAFHRLVCAVTRNPVIIFTINSVMDVLEENVLRINVEKGFIQRQVLEHERILEKIRDRKADEAYEEMREHIGIVHEKLEAMRNSRSKQDSRT